MVIIYVHSSNAIGTSQWTVPSLEQQAACFVTSVPLIVDCNKGSKSIYTLWLFNIAMENGPCSMVYPLKMVIFYSYVK